MAVRLLSRRDRQIKNYKGLDGLPFQRSLSNPILSTSMSGSAFGIVPPQQNFEARIERETESERDFVRSLAKGILSL